jgi:hypothetical protein
VVEPFDADGRLNIDNSFRSCFVSERPRSDDHELDRPARHLPSNDRNNRYVQSIKEAFVPRATHDTVQELCQPENHTFPRSPLAPVRLRAAAQAGRQPPVGGVQKQPLPPPAEDADRSSDLPRRGQLSDPEAVHASGEALRRELRLAAAETATAELRLRERPRPRPRVLHEQGQERQGYQFHAQS